MKSKSQLYGLTSGLLLAALRASTWAKSEQGAPGENYPILTRSYLLQSFDSSQKVKEEKITPELQKQYFYSNCGGSKGCDSALPEGAIMFKAPPGSVQRRTVSSRALN
ncbi:hypothetical protein [Cedecea davisae]|uniref:hypothetical protein n=1 Tax=Cedecea davisae TaxID=158484 RepID=UPI002430C524|nr:hypothetical protein [Cedecea davisae]